MSVLTRDLFMQWYPLDISTDDTDASDVVRADFVTGLSVRGDYAWIIHKIEFAPQAMNNFGGGDNQWNFSLCTTDGYPIGAGEDVPNLNQKGVIGKFGFTYSLTTEGAWAMKLPLTWESLPPTIIAAPKLSLYANCNVDAAAVRDQQVVMRIGFTTVPMDAAMYLEIAETFQQL